METKSKRETYYFNVYDLEDNLIYENKTSAELSEELGIPRTRVSGSALTGSVVKGNYKILNVNPELQCTTGMRWGDSDIKRWNEVRTPFLNVEWVKERSYGVKVLRGSKS